MKKSFIIAFFASFFGYCLGNAAFPQKHIQHALDYPIAFGKIVTVSNIADAKEAHAFVISTNYLSLEEMSVRKLFDYAGSAEDYIYISNVVTDKDFKQAAIQYASKQMDWTTHWPSYDESCNGKKFKKIKKYRKTFCISQTDHRQEILTISKKFAPDTFNINVDAILSNTAPVSLGNFADALSDIYKDDVTLQASVENKMMAIPATSATLNEWAKVRSTEPIEIIAAKKMAEASTSATDLISAHPRLRYGTALDTIITAVKNKSNTDDCLAMLEGDLLNYADSYLYRVIRNHCQNIVAASRHGWARKKYSPIIRKDFTSTKVVGVNIPKRVIPEQQTFALDADCVEKNPRQRDKCLKEVVISDGKIVSYGKQVTMPRSK